jgi:hypothetical protein
MKRPQFSGERMIALFLLGLLAFNPPLLAIFSVDGRVLGLPVLYCYLFLAWGLLIGFMVLWGSGGGEASRGQSQARDREQARRPARPPLPLTPPGPGAPR